LNEGDNGFFVNFMRLTYKTPVNNKLKYYYLLFGLIIGAFISFLGIRLNSKPAPEKNQDLIKQINDFMKYSHSKAMAVFHKIVKWVKNGVLMIIHIYAKVSTSKFKLLLVQDSLD
jgi:uncharacterized protein YneF (UPF0154 family)